MRSAARMLGLAAAVPAVLCALALAAPAAWGAGAWYELGTAASPVNHDADH